MKIEAGKYYRTRGGDVVGPIRQRPDSRYCWESGTDCWTEKGNFEKGRQSLHDLISEVYVSDTPPAEAPAPEITRLDSRTEWKLFRQMGPHELVTNAPAQMLEIKTLRDEFAFAMVALTGLMADPNNASGTEESAQWAYRIADAMMEARKK
jgi:hypothetical protein